jgi:CubicO group peptidase (beta-lactamase class C family)
VKRIFASKLRGEIGKEHFYANSGYSLLAAIVEIASGQPYESYLNEHLLLPAGMRETGYRLPTWGPRRIPVGYKDGERWGTMLDKPWAPDGPYWALRGNGGIESTLSDLWAWSRALDSDSVLSAAALKKLFTPYVKEGPGADSSYAYGWSVSRTPWKTRLISHDGGNGVFSADFRRYPDDRIVVITASNASNVKAWKFSSPLARIAHGDIVEPDVPPTGAMRPLGDGPRDTIIREFEAAFNSRDLDKMRGFRAAHVENRPDGPTEERRDQMTKQMWKDLGTISIEGVVAEDADLVTVQAKPSKAPPLRIRFAFNGENRVSGIMIEAGGEGGPE